MWTFCMCHIFSKKIFPFTIFLLCERQRSRWSVEFPEENGCFLPLEAGNGGQTQKNLEKRKICTVIYCFLL